MAQHGLGSTQQGQAGRGPGRFPLGRSPTPGTLAPSCSRLLAKWDEGLFGEHAESGSAQGLATTAVLDMMASLGSRGRAGRAPHPGVCSWDPGPEHLCLLTQNGRPL